MSTAGGDPRCPECGEPIGATATYCMHCSADLTEELARSDADHDGRWDEVDGGSVDAATTTSDSAGTGGAAAGERQAADGRLLAPDGLVDDSLTVIVGIGGGFVIGVVATFVLVATTGSAWALAVGVAGWLLVTAHLVRRRTVQEALARTGYGLAIVLLSIPLVALGPSTESAGLGDRMAEFALLLVVAAVPAAVAAGLGYVASRLVPESGTEG